MQKVEADLLVRLESCIFELERVQDDLLIIGHASVIRCLLAYLVGLPPSEVPAVEIARGDLVEVTPASYGVMTRAFHFWYVIHISVERVTDMQVWGRTR